MSCFVKECDQTITGIIYQNWDFYLILPAIIKTLKSFILKIIGRNFEYDEALNIVQFEEYTEDINFDEIKRYDVQKRVRNLESQKLNFRKGRKHVGKNHRKHHGRNPREKSGNKREKVTNKNLLGMYRNKFRHCTVFRKASILSGSGFNKFLASKNFFRENTTD